MGTTDDTGLDDAQRDSLRVVYERLAQPLMKSAVSTRKQGNMTLSYVTGYHVKNTLNQVFGPLGWTYRITNLNRVQEEHEGEHWKVGYMALVVFEAKGFDFVREDVGFGGGKDRDLGRAHESASKEAVTDGLKRAVCALGDNLGHILYKKAK